MGKMAASGRIVGIVGIIVTFVLPGCIADRPRPAPAPDLADYMERAKCLNRTMCEQIRSRASKDVDGNYTISFVSMDLAASYAADICNLPLHTKMLRHIASYGSFSAFENAQNDEHIEDLRTEREALAIGMDQEKACLTMP